MRSPVTAFRSREAMRSNEMVEDDGSPLVVQHATVGTEQAFIIHSVVALDDVLKAAREHQLADVAAEDALGNARQAKEPFNVTR